MQEKSRRTWLMLALASYSVAAALAIGLTSLESRVTAPAQTAGMQLQGNPDGEVAAAPDTDDEAGDKQTSCEQRDCLTPKPELAFARINQEPVLVRNDAPHAQESKVFTALGDDVPRKSKD